MPGPRAGKSENGFFRGDTWLQVFQNYSKICKAEVTLTPLINKICKPWLTVAFNIEWHLITLLQVNVCTVFIYKQNVYVL